MAFLVGYDNASSSLTFTVREDRFPSWNGRSPDHVPHPVIDFGDFNRNLRIVSSYPGFVDVDWGDGIKEQYPFVKQRGVSNYQVIFRSLDVEFKKNPDSTVWWFIKENGSQYVPVPYHKYQDSSEKIVTMKFSGKIDGVLDMDGIYLHEWPVMDLPDLTRLYAVRAMVANGDIPFDRIGRSVNIVEVQMGSLRHTGVWSNIPEGLLRLEKLMNWGCNSVFDFSADPNSNWRRIAEWKDLASFNWNWNNVPKYGPEFNSIPAKDIKLISDKNDIPTMEEVDKVGDDKTTYNFMAEGSSWKEDLVRGKLNKIQSTYCRSSTVPVDKLPDWLLEVREFRHFDLGDGGSFVRTQERADTFTRSIYELTTTWEHTTMSQTAADGLRNQFYGLRISLFRVDIPYNKRPSGELRAPEGFVKGVSNGTPTTPMEMIYVLQNNYNQVWVVAPEPTALRSRSAGRIEPFILGVVDGEAIVGGGDLLIPSGDKYNFTCKEEGIAICEDLGVDSLPVIEYFDKIEKGEI